MYLETERLILRPWLETDAAALYQHAKDPRVGPIAGWPPHTSVENSREIIRQVMAVEETYAIVQKGEFDPIGSVGLNLGDRSNLTFDQDEGELGYWLAVPYWGQGLMPEAVRALLHHAFCTLELQRIWCGYFDGNEQSRRVAEKCGFRFHHTEYGKFFSLINQVKTQHVTCLIRRQWETEIANR